MTFFRNAFFTVFTVLLVSTHLEAMNQQPQIKTIKDVPAYCANLAKQLTDGPGVITYDKNIWGEFFKQKMVELENAEDCKISALLSEYAQSACESPRIIFNEDHLLVIRSYLHLMAHPGKLVELIRDEISKMNDGQHEQSVKSEVYDLANFFFKTRLAGKMSQEEIDEVLTDIFGSRRSFCSLQELETVYEIYLQELQKNWCHGKSTVDEWSLFIKREGLLNQEEVLIRCLAKKFGLEKSIECEDCQEGLLLWVKNDVLDGFQRIFDLEIQ